MAWPYGTALNTEQTVNTAGMDTVIVTIIANASTTGGVITFEVYDGAAWLPIKAPTIIDYTTVGAITLTANYAKGFQVPVAGFPQFRARLSTVLAGASASVAVTSIVSSAPDVSLVTVGLDPAQPLPAGSNSIGSVVNAAGSAQIGSVYVNNPVGAANVASAQISIGVSATAIVAARTGAAGTGRVAVTLFNNGAATVYLGGSSVTTSNGMILPPGASMTINATAAIYGISGAAGQTISAMESY